jgi:gluconolactonase
MKYLRALLLFSIYGCILPFFFQCQTGPQEEATEKEYATTGSIERLDPALDAIILPGTPIEILAEGFEWSEGPVWVELHQMLLFSDIPRNSIFKWTEEDSITLYLSPAGYTGDADRGGESGSNGLLLDPEGNLVLCQHGDRRVARMSAPLDDPKPEFETLAGEYDGKRLNSPNDAAYHSNGNLYFTDPPYGLEGNVDDPEKEIPYQGVYRWHPDGTLDLLLDTMTRPNGIAFSPGDKTIYIANSDPDYAIWMAYDVQEDGTLANGRLFYDATSNVGEEKGLPDGLKVNRNGYVFATGPGGVWIFDPSGKLLGRILTGEATANCAFNADESVLYITADMYLLRLRLGSSS